jgi:hypothetical protein
LTKTSKCILKQQHGLHNGSLNRRKHSKYYLKKRRHTQFYKGKIVMAKKHKLLRPAVEKTKKNKHIFKAHIMSQTQMIIFPFFRIEKHEIITLKWWLQQYIPL